MPVRLCAEVVVNQVELTPQELSDIFDEWAPKVSPELKALFLNYISNLPVTFAVKDQGYKDLVYKLPKGVKSLPAYLEETQLLTPENFGSYYDEYKLPCEFTPLTVIENGFLWVTGLTPDEILFRELLHQE